MLPSSSFGPTRFDFEAVVAARPRPTSTRQDFEAVVARPATQPIRTRFDFEAIVPEQRQQRTVIAPSESLIGAALGALPPALPTAGVVQTDAVPLPVPAPTGTPEDGGVPGQPGDGLQTAALKGVDLVPGLDPRPIVEHPGAPLVSFPTGVLTGGQQLGEPDQGSIVRRRWIVPFAIVFVLLGASLVGVTVLLRNQATDTAAQTAAATSFPVGAGSSAAPAKTPTAGGIASLGPTPTPAPKATTVPSATKAPPPSAKPIATASPKPTSAPVIAPTVVQTSFTGSCTSGLKAFALTLDNSASNRPVDWSISFDKSGYPGDWGSTKPTSGTLKAGTSTTATITPASDLCSAVKSKTTFTLTVAFSGAKPVTVTFEVSP